MRRDEHGANLVAEYITDCYPLRLAMHELLCADMVTWIKIAYGSAEVQAAAVVGGARMDLQDVPVAREAGAEDPGSDKKDPDEGDEDPVVAVLVTPEGEIVAPPPVPADADMVTVMEVGREQPIVDADAEPLVCPPPEPQPPEPQQGVGATDFDLDPTAGLWAPAPVPVSDVCDGLPEFQDAFEEFADTFDFQDALEADEAGAGKF